MRTSDFDDLDLTLLDEREQNIFRSIWILRDSITSLKIVINEDIPTAVSCLLKIGIPAGDELQSEIFSLCNHLCRRDTLFAKEIATSALAEKLVKPLQMCSDDIPPFLAYILALNEKHTTEGCIFASHNNSVIIDALERNACTTQTSKAIQNLWILVRNKKIRAFFLTGNGVQNVLRFISRFCLSDQVMMAQTLYEALGICWLALYDKETVILACRNRVIGITHTVMKHSTREKCVRMSLLVLEMLLWHSSKDHSGGTGSLRLFVDISSSGMLKTIHTLRKKAWEDTDISEKLESLENAVMHKIESMTTFTEYKNELQYGELEWSPIHTNMKFWKENIRQFEANEFEILGFLREILFRSDSDQSLAVSCHDIGEILRHHPQGRKLLAIPALSGVKERITDLLKHASAEVRHHALLAIQKILIQKWEFIG